MKTFLDCYPCILRQAIEAMRMVGVAEERQYQVLHQGYIRRQLVSDGVDAGDI